MIPLLLLTFNLIETTYLTYTFAVNPTHYNGTVLFIYYHIYVFGYLWTLYITMIMTMDQWIPFVSPFARVGYEMLLKTSLGQQAQLVFGMVFQNAIVVNYLCTVKLYGDLLIAQINWLLQSRLRQQSMVITETLKNWGLTKIEISRLKILWEK